VNTPNLDDQVIMVTGISGQIGQMLVSTALKRGAKVLGIDVSIDKMKKIAKDLEWDASNIQMSEVDIRKNSDIKLAFESAVRKFGYVSSLINNAGVSVFTPWTDRSDEEFDLVTDVNLKGTFNCMKVFMEHCIKTKKKGSIVNVASHYGLISPDPKIYTDCARRSPEIYGATKAGVIQMTKYFSVNAIADGADIRINAVAPGGVRNPWDPQGEDFQRLYSERCPMGRLAEIEEIIGPIFFLLSKDASYINGHTLVIDGGMTAW
jgi:NAD(P)-dependent dehydrogenase (short-subunit alcohol dehydrogenase family)